MTELKLHKLKYSKASSPSYAILKSLVKLSFKKKYGVQKGLFMAS